MFKRINSTTYVYTGDIDGVIETVTKILTPAIPNKVVGELRDLLLGDVMCGLLVKKFLESNHDTTALHNHETIHITVSGTKLLTGILLGSIQEKIVYNKI